MTLQLAQINPAMLTPIIQRVLDSSDAVLGDWQMSPLPHTVINPVSGGLHRVSGSAHVGAETQPWSVILKIMHLPLPHASVEWNSSDDPTHFNYWQREFLIYQSGLLDQLAEGLAAPRCFQALEQPDGSCWLWLEDIHGTLAPEWSLERYGLAARHIGRFQGSFLIDRSLPTASCLSRGWLQTRVAGFAPHIEQMHEMELWKHPLLREAFPQPIVERIQRLWNERAHVFAALDRLPQTLCHLDLYPPNLFARQDQQGNDQTVLIDWSFAGMGAVGQDIGNLVPDTLWMMHVPIESLRELEHFVFNGYAEGLHDVGWHGDVLMLYLGYTAGFALAYSFLIGWLLKIARDPEAQGRIEQRWQRPFSAILAQRAPIIYHALDCADEARLLIDALGVS